MLPLQRELSRRRLNEDATHLPVDASALLPIDATVVNGARGARQRAVRGASRAGDL